MRRLSRKIHGFMLGAGLLLGLGLLQVSTIAAQDVNFSELARKVVKTSANVKPGDVVVVSGGTHTILLMEELAIQAQMVGGMPNLLLSSAKVTRSLYMDVPDKYLEQPPAYFTEWLKHINVWIGLPDVENPKAVYGDVPEERFAKANKAFQSVLDSLNASGVRVVSIGYPTKEGAAAHEVDYATFQKMHWDAVNADYQKISEKGRRLKSMLRGAKTVKVTTPSGTHFTFSLAGRPIFVDDGISTEERTKSKLFLNRVVSLPSGTVFFAPLETSAQGEVVVPKTLCRFAPMTGVSFEFKNGQLRNLKADAGQACFEQSMAPYSGSKDMFGYFEIGLNPSLKVMEAPGNYHPDGAAGLVWIGVGDNQLLGGGNKVEGQGGFNFPIANATVEIDGKTVVKDGQLTF
jgi:aminopeptidase